MTNLLKLLCLLLLSFGVTACSATSPPISTYYGKINQPEILEKASRGEAQYIVVELIVQPNLVQVVQEVKEQAHRDNQLFLERTLDNSLAYKDYIARCNAIVNKVFPNNRIGNAVVQSIYFRKLIVVAKVPDAKSLDLILRRPEVKSVNVPSTQEWPDEPKLYDLYDDDPNCPKATCAYLD